MNRTPLYSTNATLYGDTTTTNPPPPTNLNSQPTDSVIRPPIRNAYDTQKQYDDAVQIGINFANEKNIQYIDHY